QRGWCSPGSTSRWTRRQRAETALPRDGTAMTSWDGATPPAVLVAPCWSLDGLPLDLWRGGLTGPPVSPTAVAISGHASGVCSGLSPRPSVTPDSGPETALPRSGRATNSSGGATPPPVFNTPG